MVLSFPLAAQIAPAKIRSLTTEDGLPQGFITGIVQDRKGFMWLGTRDGLARYDGRSIKVLRSEEGDSTTLSGNIIRFLSLDPHNNIWVQYDNGSTDLLNPETEQVRRLTAAPAFKQLVTSKPEFAFSQLVPDADGNAYRLYTNDHPQHNRVVHLSLRSGQTKTLALPPGEIPQGLANNEGGNCWLLTSKNLYAIGRNGWLGKKISLPRQAAKDLAAMYRGTGPVNFIIGKNNTLALPTLTALWNYNPATRQWTKGPVPVPQKNTGMPWMVHGQDGNNYLVAAYQVHRVAPDGTLSLLWTNTLRYPEIITAMVDRTNVLWVSTNTFGLRLIDLNATGFRSYPIAHDFFYDVLKHLYPIRTSTFQPNLYGNYNLSGRSGMDKAGNLWFINFLYSQLDGKAVKPNHLARLVPSGAGIVNLDTLSQLRGDNRINNFVFDRNNTCWATSVKENKLLRINTATGKILDHVLLHKELWHPNHLLAVDSLLLLVHNDAVQVYNQPSGKLTLYRHQPGVQQFRNAYLIMATPDPLHKEIIWLATRGIGLLRLNLKTATLQLFGTRQGLPNNTVYAILPDGKGYFWCSSNKGIFRFNPRNYAVLSFTEKDGLQGNEFNRFQYLQLPDGRMVFGGTQGYTIFHPDSIRIDSFRPHVAITDIAVQNESINRYPEGSRAPGLADTLRLRYNQNFITFRFAALQFTNPGKIQYRYRLSGLNKEWIGIGNQNTANFTNLPPGQYLLQLNASNTAGIWSPHITTLALFISPPWWKTWWAYLLYGVSAGALTIFIFRLQLRQAKARQEAELKQKEAEQLKAIDEIKSRFFSNITHELRTPLSLIISPVDQLLRDGATPAAVRTSLNMVQRNAAQLLRLINQLLDMSKLESGNMQLSLSQGNLCLFFEECIAAFKNAAHAKNIRLYFQGADAGQDVLFDAGKMEMVLYNLLSNAVKFTAEGGEVQVLLEQHETGANLQVRFSVHDTGIGIAPENLTHIFERFYQADNSATRRYEGSGIGLALVKELVQLMGGSITVDSKPRQGTRFAVALPLQKAASQTVPQWMQQKADQVVALPTNAVVPMENDKEAPLLLVAEDNEELRAFIAQTLQNRYRVLTAANGQEALELAQAELPDVIISDLMMPLMDGYSLCRAIKSAAATEHIAVVLLTAKAAHDSVVAGLRSGADDYITKPFHFDELQLRLANILERRDKLRRFYQGQLRDPDEPLVQKDTTPPFLSGLYTIIDHHLNDSTFTVEKLATHAAMSSRTLNRKLASLAGLSANEFIRQYRLKKSLSFLQTGSNVSQAAYSVGFETHAHFTTSFKAFFGLTPSEFLNTKQSN
ncbi:hybrid sensor histidine kinase/response regulator transcription factor [Cnuella takakiae]|uniref:hybrid sensor histidine kinase/response regulator transcription factor n=1 Tax=Cnuella takakiae TaxID=1302690 RepID=UPI00130110A9|nr:ATP-binding protein [Cnuella takakiae]